MNETVQLTLDSKLVEELKQATSQDGTSIDSVFADLALQYLREARDKKLQTEFERYQAMHAELKEKYLSQHVAIFEGRLVDHDSDVTEMVIRVRQRFGRAPVLITQVDEKPMREFWIRSPRLVRSE